MSLTSSEAADMCCRTGQVGSALCPSGFGSGVQFAPAQFLGALQTHLLEARVYGYTALPCIDIPLTFELPGVPAAPIVIVIVNIHTAPARIPSRPCKDPCHISQNACRILVQICDGICRLWKIVGKRL